MSRMSEPMLAARMRFYDPTTAQFISRDPMVMVTRSPYGYVGHNPLNATDPSGLCGLWGDDTCLGDAVSTVSDHWQGISRSMEGDCRRDSFSSVPQPLTPPFSPE
jgi:hypothetical protein